MAYDIKYRRRALEYWAGGHTKEQTAETFKVSPSTLSRWKSQLKETGTLERKPLQRGWKKICPKRLAEYIEKHPDSYQMEIAREFNCSDRAISKALRKLNITRKKNHGISRGEHNFEK